MSRKYLDKVRLGQLAASFPSLLEFSGEEAEPAVLVATGEIAKVLAFLKQDPLYDYDMLNNLTAVDYPEYFEVVYHLYSRQNRHTVTVKTRAAKDLPEVESVTGLWPGANFQEREVYDLLGIHFRNHPNLQRILLPDTFIGYPLRKDFKAVKPEMRC